MAKRNTKSLAGRPTKMTDEVVTRLESIFKVGGTIAEACAYAQISERMYYYNAERDEVFLQKMSAAKHYADIVAKNVIVDSIVKDRDLNSAKWWLEKRQFKDSSPIAQVNVIAILGGSSVQSNNSNAQVIEATEAD